MTTIYMATVPANYYLHFRHFRRYFDRTDVKKWVIAREKGKTGYEHWQVRFKSCEPLAKIRQETLFRNGSVDKADYWSDYERKGGRYITSDDTDEIRSVRFGKPTGPQQYYLDKLKTQGIREIDVWYDPNGYSGKSWLVNYLFETGQAYWTPPYLSNVKEIIQDIASGYKGEGIIVIDIPRSWKWSEQLYTVIESVKDGLIKDCRYTSEGKTRNIRGVKVLVLCNTLPKLNKLSQDRWRIL